MIRKFTKVIILPFILMVGLTHCSCGKETVPYQTILLRYQTRVLRDRQIGEIGKDTVIGLINGGSGLSVNSLIVMARVRGELELQYFFEAFYLSPGGIGYDIVSFAYCDGYIIFYNVDNEEKARIKCPSLKANVHDIAKAKAQLGWYYIADYTLLDNTRRDKGMKLLRESANAGCREGMRYLGQALLRYDIKEKNNKEARMWLTKAASVGDEEARRVLCKIGEQGRGSKQ